ncbi:MAG TPA: cytochrome c [Parvularculaceae bacterium]|nr:cytochrome c [Parvularculaceae bacterium]
MRNLAAIAAVLSAAPFFGAAAETSPDGAKLYQRCAACHLPNGAGVPGAFPALAGHVNAVAQHAPGRDYLVMAVTAGVMGEIDIDGAKIRGFMPAQSGLGDADVAAILNYAAAMPASSAAIDAPADKFTAEEVAEIRARYKGATPNSVHAIRTAAMEAVGDEAMSENVSRGGSEK